VKKSFGCHGKPESADGGKVFSRMIRAKLLARPNNLGGKTMEYQGFKINIRLAGMEGFEATIVDANGCSCGKVYSRVSKDGAVAEARTFIDKKLA